MKLFISYFYNIRFFPVNLVPVSTAMYDPKWYHNFKSSSVVFRDKRGVINGLRVEELSPFKVESTECRNCILKDQSSCSFIKQYRDYLFSLNFSDIYNKLIHISSNFNNADICLMAYEKPDNPCSERSSLIEWFKSNNIELTEFCRDTVCSI